MSFSSLPIDVYDEITSHLVGDHVRGKVRPVTLGKALSLVCRNLRPIGQALVWRDVYFDYAKLVDSVPEVLAKFEAYPHLHAFVESIESENETSPSTSDIARIISILLDFLPHCHKLEMLEIQFPEQASPSLIRNMFNTVSRFEHLEHLCLLGSSLVFDPDMIKTLHIGFPQLESLRLQITVPPGGRKVIKAAEPEGTRGVLLRRLTLDIDEIEAEQIFQLLLTLAGSMKDVLTLTINKFLTHEQHLYYGEKAPFSLARFLSAIPHSMHLFHAKGIYFFGSLSYPVTRLKPSALALIEGPSVQFYLKTLSAQTFVTLKKMKDKKGISRWHRVVEA
ncbi:hypothetical protein JCM5353_003947 [Sporobolomyces roseus]